MLNDKLPVVVPARPQPPSPSPTPSPFRCVAFSVSVSVSVSVAGVNEAAFCLSAISFLLFSFYLFALPEGEGKRQSGLKNAIR